MDKYIGYKQADQTTPYARFYDEKITPVAMYISKALNDSPYSQDRLLPLEKASFLMKKGYFEVENGYTIAADGSIRVAVLTSMPNVSPQMWDWWFGWHGNRANKYKLWHPKAHQSAEWQDGNQELEGYIGRVSMIEEYIGTRLEKANIQFISPTELGFDAQELADKSRVVVICARVGYTHLPLNHGYLVHQIRATEGGAEMRSRFWIGGPHIQIRYKGWLPNLLSKGLQKVHRVSKKQAIDLLTHCSEEMNHLAAFLPQLYAQYHQK
jgi:DAPG hydrolase PhiG domain